MAADQPQHKVETTAAQQAAQAAEANRLRQAALSAPPAHVEQHAAPAHPAAPAVAPARPAAPATPPREVARPVVPPAPHVEASHAPVQRTVPPAVVPRVDQPHPVATPTRTYVMPPGMQQREQHINGTPAPAVPPGIERHLYPGQPVRTGQPAVPGQLAHPRQPAPPGTPATVYNRGDQTHTAPKPVQVGQPAPIAHPTYDPRSRQRQPEQMAVTPQSHQNWKPAVAGGIAAGATLGLTSSQYYRTMTNPGHPNEIVIINRDQNNSNNVYNTTYDSRSYFPTQGSRYQQQLMANNWRWNRERGWDYADGDNGWLWGRNDWWNTQSQWNQPPGIWISIDGNWVNIGGAYGQQGYGPVYGAGYDTYSYQDPNAQYQDTRYYQDPNAQYQDTRYYQDPNAQYTTPDQLAWPTPAPQGYGAPQRYPYGTTDSQRYRYAQDPGYAPYQDAQYQEYLSQQNPQYWANYGRPPVYQDPRYYGGGMPFVGGGGPLGIIGGIMSMIGGQRHHHGGFPFNMMMNNFAYNTSPYAYQNQYDYGYQPVQVAQTVPYYYPQRHHHHRWY